jgi:formate dehydrogenase accessory protein FdhD
MGDADDTNDTNDTASDAPDVQLDAVEEAAVWLELNGSPAVTWMCTPERLDELVVGWLFGEGYIDTQAEIVRMRPCTSELGFWVEVPRDKYDAVERAERRRVLASGCGAVTTILGSMFGGAGRRAPEPARA